MATLTATRDNITLTCSPEKEGDRVVISYKIANGGNVDVYVSDAGTRVEMPARVAVADVDAVSIWRGEDNFAHVLKGVATLPADRFVPGRVMPLMWRLAPGAAVERKLTLALPLAEHSPYYSIGNLRDYRLSEIEGIRFAVDVLPAPAADFVAAPVAYAEGLVDVGVKGTLPLMRRLGCGFRARGMHLMLRTDAYPRPVE